MADFTDILSKPAAQVEAPKPRPTGTYLGVVQGVPKQVERGEHKILEFNIKLMAPQDDVDQDQLAAAGDVSDWPPVQQAIFLSSEGGAFNLKRFLTDTLQIDPGTEDNSRSLGEMCGESPGKQLMVTLKHEPYTDKASGEARIATRIASTAAV